MEKLNNQTEHDLNPIAMRDKCIESIGIVTVLSPYDANIGYLQVMIENEDRNKILQPRHGHFCFLCMLSGLANPPRTFCAIVELTLQALHVNSPWSFLVTLIFLRGLSKSAFTMYDKC